MGEMMYPRLMLLDNTFKKSNSENRISANSQK